MLFKWLWPKLIKILIERLTLLIDCNDLGWIFNKHHSLCCYGLNIFDVVGHGLVCNLTMDSRGPSSDSDMSTYKQASKVHEAEHDQWN